ncbi:MAG: carbohydrate-binding protein, partial [Opitutaceae bacterium]
YQAENGTASAGSILNETTNAGGTPGTNGPYVNTNNAVGAWWEITVNVASAGTYSLDFRFANGGTADRPADIRVNGVVVQSALSFPITGWTTWSDVIVSKTLNAGNNTIRLTATTANGCANLDKLTVQ